MFPTPSSRPIRAWSFQRAISQVTLSWRRCRLSRSGTFPHASWGAGHSEITGQPTKAWSTVQDAEPSLSAPAAEWRETLLAS